MPIPASINDLSTTAGSNSPAGSESPSLIDDYLRTYASYIALLRDAAQNNSFNYVVATGSANAITATFSPAITALTDGLILNVKASLANTGAATFSPNGLTAKPIVSMSHAALVGGEIGANGFVSLEYNTSVGGGSWVLVASSGGAYQSSGAVGQVRNLKMNIAAASPSATITADEIVVKTALGGLCYTLTNFSQVINVGNIGAGGMDTGSSPASGWVAIYAIYNPATGAKALLAKNATAGVQTEVYSGANMPAGYTASALVSVWGTTGAGQLVFGCQLDRLALAASTTVLNTSTQQASFTSLSISSAIPANAKSVGGSMRVTSGSIGDYIGQLSSASTALGAIVIEAGYTGASGQFSIGIVTAQTIWYAATVSAGTMNATINISSYTF